MSEPMEQSLIVSGNSTNATGSADSGLYRSVTKMTSTQDGTEYTINDSDGSNLAAYLGDLFTAAWSTTNQYWRPSVSLPEDMENTYRPLILLHKTVVESH